MCVAIKLHHFHNHKTAVFAMRRKEVKVSKEEEMNQNKWEQVWKMFRIKIRTDKWVYRFLNLYKFITAIRSLSPSIREHAPKITPQILNPIYQLCYWVLLNTYCIWSWWGRSSSQSSGPEPCEVQTGSGSTLAWCRSSCRSLPHGLQCGLSPQWHDNSFPCTWH